jgi:ADP-ribose pyrophosphatase
MDSNKIEKQISTTPIYSGKLLSLRKDIIELPNGANTTRECVSHTPVVCMLPIDENGYVHTVKQFRYAVETLLLEIPAGGIEMGEQPEKAAVRELQEEIGMTCSDLIPLGGFWLTPGWCDEYMYSFLAKGLSEAKLKADDDENISVVKIPFNELVREVKSGLIQDVKTIATVLLAENYLIVS